MSRRTRLLLLLAGVLLVAWFVWRTAERWVPSRAEYPAQGFVYHSGAVDWTQAAERADFVYLDATEGLFGANPRFLQTAAQARDAGFSVGATHRFDLCLSAREQAVNLLAHLPRDATDLPLAVELTDAACAGRPPKVIDAVRALADFLTLAEAGGRPPSLIRETPAMAERYPLTGRLDRPLWLTRRFRQPAADWELWTANPARPIDGVDDPVEWVVARAPATSGDR